MNRVIRLNENYLRRIVNNTVRKVLRESLSTVHVRTYGLNPREENAAREIVLQNKRVVGSYQIRSAHEYAKEWMQHSEDKGERHFIRQCLQDGLDIYELVDGWQSVGLVGF